ncbi:MAG: hypothetical protein L7T19_09520 [Pseudomonadales bacterium]|nr:hypothetical protein [Pseudomonadales bacterium]
MKKASVETTPAARRKNLADDVEAFLKAGNEIEKVPSGVSAQDPQGRGKPLRIAQGDAQNKTSGIAAAASAGVDGQKVVVEATEVEPAAVATD